MSTLLLLVGAALALPDLTMPAINAQATAKVGETIAFTYTVENIGPDYAAATGNRFRISDDIYYNLVNDLICDHWPGVGIGSGASRTFTATGCVIPANLAPGDWYIVGSADAWDDLLEVDDWNGFGYDPITIEAQPTGDPDLTMTLNAPDWVFPNQATNLDYSVSNSGTADAASFGLRFRLSVDEVYNTADPLMCDDFAVSALVGTTLTPTATACLPQSTWPAGAAFVVASVDAWAEVVESNEANNFGFDPVMVGTIGNASDLIAEAFSIPGSVAAGSGFSATYTLSNWGGLASGGFDVAVRWSTDSVYTTSDTFLCSASVGNTTSGQSRSGTATSCVIPGGTQGSGYVVAMIEASSDGDTSNNGFVSVPVFLPGPDPETNLVVGSMTAPSVVDAGAFFSVSGTVDNLGDLDGSAHLTEVWLATSQTGANAQTLCDVQSGGIVAGGSGSWTLNDCLVPAGTAEGDYFVVVAVDVDFDVDESNENDNTWAQGVFVQATTGDTDSDSDTDLGETGWVLPEDSDEPAVDTEDPGVHDTDDEGAISLPTDDAGKDAPATCSSATNLPSSLSALVVGLIVVARRRAWA